MKAKVIGFLQGPTSSGWMTWYCARLDCGHNWYDPTRSWEPVEGVSANLGDEKDCSTCERHAEAVARLKALDKNEISYLRFSPRFAYPEQGIFGQYHAYRRDPASPSGVILHSSYPATKEIDAIIDARRLCAISPTEGR